ncbi:heavy metal-binding domain-containing protein [Actinomycetospora chiangmaiensis]|uniref:heavy metal-binding domain-containing protein n=1 Tax=Actinomycetospora chiangmaiensis TaxID=402650 RepID=UPI0003770EAC|nr:heavy metal-binding domain-containing protein [Actinomycetospora chiangmaiensis]
MSEQWDGRGLPPVAAERVRRAAAGGPWTSMLSVPSAAGLATTEYEPVGEVMGSIVQNVGWSGYGGCGGFGGGILGGVAGPMAPMPAFRPYVEALERGYGTALHRMRLEAAAIGADGVVGVILRADHLGQGSREFVALGTAVRSRTGPPPQKFTTSLAGQDVAKLLAAGWLPAEIVYGIAISIRHDDWATRQQASWVAGNTEVTGYTQLATVVRADARHRFAEQVAGAGGQGAIVSSLGVRMWHVEPAENHRDHVAEATVFGDALVAVERSAPRVAAPLTVMPLRPRGGLS